MGEAKIIDQLARMLVPEEVLEHFQILKAEEKHGKWFVELVEKEGVEYIPKEIFRNGKAVANGYCNPVDLQTFPAKGKEVYLRLIRRRWKIRGENKSYMNIYDFHEEGMKATREFGAFLKELDREQGDQHWERWTRSGDEL